MADGLALAAAVVAVSATGVMAPGPLFAANVSYGLRGGARAGLRVAAGHAAVELPLVLLLGAGAAPLGGIAGFREASSVLGAAALFAFAALQARAALGRGARAPSWRGPLAAGAALSALNPFFLAWWLTVGLKLVSDAVAAWALAGALAVFAMHVWMDFAWLGGTAHLAGRGSRLLGGRAYRAAMLGLAGAMAGFGVWFLAGA